MFAPAPSLRTLATIPTIRRKTVLPRQSGHPLYWAMTNEHAAQPARRNVGLLIRKYLTYLPLTGFLVSLVIALVLGVDDWKVTALEVGLFWLVGISGILLGSAHLFTPAPVAKAIGWPSSRFQWEVGLAGVGYGVAGVMAPAFDRDFWLATIMLGAALGHVRSMIAEPNFAPGNAGYV